MAVFTFSKKGWRATVSLTAQPGYQATQEGGKGVLKTEASSAFVSIRPQRILESYAEETGKMLIHSLSWLPVF